MLQTKGFLSNDWQKKLFYIKCIQYFSIFAVIIYQSVILEYVAIRICVIERSIEIGQKTRPIKPN